MALSLKPVRDLISTYKELQVVSLKKPAPKKKTDCNCNRFPKPDEVQNEVYALESKIRGLAASIFFPSEVSGGVYNRNGSGFALAPDLKENVLDMLYKELKMTIIVSEVRSRTVQRASPAQWPGNGQPQPPNGMAPMQYGDNVSTDIRFFLKLSTPNGTMEL